MSSSTPATPADLGTPRAAAGRDGVTSGTTLALVAVLLLAGGGWFLSAPEWVSHLLAAVVGGCVCALAFHLRVGAPLTAMERACGAMQNGDLGHTVPEVGTTEMRRIAAGINSVSADFQEVLLLFAHLVRSARRSAELLQRHVVGVEGGGESRSACEIIDDIEQMEEMIHDFKYFRVRVEDDAIVDTGITDRRSAAGTLRQRDADRQVADGADPGCPRRQEGISDERQEQGARRVSGLPRG